MTSMIRAALAAGLALLGACGCTGDDGNDRNSGSTAPELCVSSTCGDKVVLLDLPGAENIHFTPGGRLFVSAAHGVFEVTRDAAYRYHATAVTDEDCGAGGLAQVGDVLYALCGGGLFAGHLAEQPVLSRIFDLTGMCIANGMALGADGNLYVTDEPLNICVPDPKIVRLNLDPADPLHVLSQETWLQGSALGQLHLGLDNVLRFPNGIQSRGNSFFGTDGGSVYRVDLMPDGTAGPVLPLYWTATAHDDLGVAGDDLIVCDFFGGRLELISQDGELKQATALATWVGPSSARLGKPPMFRSDDILVTSQGVLVDQNLPLDQLTVFRRRP